MAIHEYIYIMKRIYMFGAIAALSLLALSCSTTPLEELKGSEPSPELTPREVVSIQLEALANDNEAREGIEIAFRFASPANRSQTGPLPRFIRLFENPLYRPLLDPVETELLQTMRRGEFVLQAVRIRNQEGRDFFYLFILGLQGQGEYENCWMTEGVQTFVGPVPASPEEFDMETI